MSQGFVLVLVTPGENPLERAQALIDQFCHRDDCPGGDSAEAPCEEHEWDCALVGGISYQKGRLWYDRYGKLPENRQFNCPSDEIRKAGDIDLRATFLFSLALILPDGRIHYLSEGRNWSTLADYAAFEDLFAEYPECYTVPFRIHC